MTDPELITRIFKNVFDFISEDEITPESIINLLVHPNWEEDYNWHYLLVLVALEVTYDIDIPDEWANEFEKSDKLTIRNLSRRLNDLPIQNDPTFRASKVLMVGSMAMKIIAQERMLEDDNYSEVN